MNSQLEDTTLVVLLLLAGCATTSPSEAEKKSIRSISISSGLGEELQYVQLGTTAFQNHQDAIRDEELLSGIISGVRQALESRGYSLAETEASSDYIVVIEPGTTCNVHHHLPGNFPVPRRTEYTMLFAAGGGYPSLGRRNSCALCFLL